MKSKTSCFNAAIFKKNVGRFWPLWALYTVILFFIMPFQLLTKMTLYHSNMTAEELANSKIQCLANILNAGINPFVPAIFAILIALALFSYLYNARSCNMVHALPVRRKELFFTNYISGLLFLLLPQILIFFLSTFISIAINIPSSEYLVHWLLLSIGITFFFFSMAAFCCMLTGHPVTAVVYFFGFNLLFTTCKILILESISHLCYGMSAYTISGSLYTLVGKTGDYFSPLYYLARYVKFEWSGSTATGIVLSGFSGIPYVIAYAITGAVLVWVSILLYRRRQLEVAGDIIAIQWIKPIFRWVCGLVIGLGLALLITEICFNGYTFFAALFICLLIFGFVSFFTAEMLLRKKFKVFARKRLLEWGAFAILSSLMLICLKLDVFGFTSYIPETSDIEKVTICCDYPVSFSAEYDIEKIKSLHQNILDNKKIFLEYEKSASINDDILVSYMSIIFTLKDGTTLRREYPIPFSDTEASGAYSASARILSLEQQPDHYLSYYFCENYEEISLTDATFTTLSDQRNGIMNTTVFSAEEADILFDALCKDLQEGNIDFRYSEDEVYYNDLSFSFHCPSGIKKMEDPWDTYQTNFFGIIHEEYYYEEPQATDSNAYVSLSVNCRHLIQALSDLGISEDELITCGEYFMQEDSGFVY